MAKCQGPFRSAAALLFADEDRFEDFYEKLTYSRTIHCHDANLRHMG